MPTYEYVCTDCQNLWEEIQKISEPAIEVCPKCGKSTAKRQISGGNFILKGGGWYADLYSSSGGGAKAAESAKPAATESKTKTEPATTSSASTDTSSTPAKSTGAASS